MKNSIKYQGIQLDRELSWRTHIDYLAKKLSKVCGMIYKLERDIASDIRGLRGIIELYYGNSDLVALNEFEKCSRVVSSQINNC